MEELTEEDWKIIFFLVRNRLKSEARRPKRINANGYDVQAYKVQNLAALQEKLERIHLFI